MDHADSGVGPGIENAAAIAAASEKVAALTIGLEDYTADLGVAKTAEGRESQYARSRLVNAAHAAGVQAIDSVFGDVGDMDGLRRWGESSRAMGSKEWAHHPGQIRVIHDAFRPTASGDREGAADCRCIEGRAEKGWGGSVEPGIEDDRSLRSWSGR